ncbi:hypothetical protein B0J12DRAFT_226190 [Macrophomina phaseolina]|uniref:Complex 1 LYR protein domain-containing protein n=1 Tax=Macrophomina phaseolina TaxID=35725 RepID=A0ABQ8GPI1_9PEZI|nr:hypothetical protein B0J12DRAFT_226190 [Macrophomina phaseolina]
MPRYSGLQRDVLSLYRQCLRVARKKPADTRKHFEQFARYVNMFFSGQSSSHYGPRYNQRTSGITKVFFFFFFLFSFFEYPGRRYLTFEGWSSKRIFRSRSGISEPLNTCSAKATDSWRSTKIPE